MQSTVDRPFGTMRNSAAGEPRCEITGNGMQQVITASRLRDGAVVFIGPDRAWVNRLAEAQVFTLAEAAQAALQSAQADEAGNLVLDIYAIDVAEKDGSLKPVKLREAIRAQGPTVHPEHGKPVDQSKHG